ncbi:hypothetical protein PG997_000394 [Apiospora hydei]|uniref:Uncharacterized protein n=1 Tax=Apiospora hydei TaxID=1337664 RepID=A0ABR1XAT7_9PEZI
MPRFRFIIFIPFVTSALAFALHLILLTSGADVTTQPSGYFLLSIDTSHVFERIIVVKNTSNATQAVGQNNGTDAGNGEGEGIGTSTGTATGTPAGISITTSTVISTATPTTGLPTTGLTTTGITTTGTTTDTPTGTRTAAPTSTSTGGLLGDLGNLIPDALKPDNFIPDLFNGSGSGSGSGSDSGSSGGGSGSGGTDSGSSGGLFGGIGNLLPNLKESATASETAEDARTGVRKFFGRVRTGVDQFWDGLVQKLENRFVDSVQKLAPGINKFISGLIGGLTKEVNDQIQEFIMEGVQKGREMAGIKDRYDIFYSNICSGNLRDRNDPSSVQYTNCGSIKDLTKQEEEEKGVTTNDRQLRQRATKPPKKRTTFFVIGTTNITFPFLEPGAVDLGSATVALDFVSTVNLASLYISLVTSILNFALAPIVFFRPDSEKLVLANIIFASMTPGSLLIGAVASTLIMAVLRDLAKDVGRALSVDAGLGAAALVMLWFSWVLSLATAAFWDLYWFVYMRREVWVKMKKPADEVGSWKRTFAGARRRMRVREEGEEELMDEEKRGAVGTDLVDEGELESWRKKSFADARRKTKTTKKKGDATEEDETSSQRRLNVRGSTDEERARGGDGISSIGHYRLSPIRLGRSRSSGRRSDSIHRGRTLA